MAAATDYNRAEPRQPRTDEWAADADPRADGGRRPGWARLRERAAADHRQLMSAARSNLGPTDPKVAALSTPERMDLFRKGGDDPELIAAFFQMGRHLLVSSSRPGGLPPNLQGLWEPGLHAAWNGDFHLNINVQMNLWPANVTGLGECNEPFFALLKLLAPARTGNRRQPRLPRLRRRAGQRRVGAGRLGRRLAGVGLVDPRRALGAGAPDGVLPVHRRTAPSCATPPGRS